MKSSPPDTSAGCSQPLFRPHRPLIFVRADDNFNPTAEVRPRTRRPPIGGAGTAVPRLPRPDNYKPPAIITSNSFISVNSMFTTEEPETSYLGTMPTTPQTPRPTLVRWAPVALALDATPSILRTPALSYHHSSTSNSHPHSPFSPRTPLDLASSRLNPVSNLSSGPLDDNEGKRSTTQTSYNHDDIKKLSDTSSSEIVIHSTPELENQYAPSSLLVSPSPNPPDSQQNARLLPSKSTTLTHARPEPRQLFTAHTSTSSAQKSPSPPPPVLAPPAHISTSKVPTASQNPTQASPLAPPSEPDAFAPVEETTTTRRAKRKSKDRRLCDAIESFTRPHRRGGTETLLLSLFAEDASPRTKSLAAQVVRGGRLGDILDLVWNSSCSAQEQMKMWIALKSLSPAGDAFSDTLDALVDEHAGRSSNCLSP
ncbi:hypothetical protein OF83DRAFT_1171112 [Amylostereum chailletii]|nr:hypothetical protein OF83DRAFT_1171112 [Amylostereum chailletii]